MLDNTDKVYKYNNETYCLHIKDSYIQLTYNEQKNKMMWAPWMSVACIKENSGQIKYAVMTYGEDLNIPELKQLDSFQVLLCLENNFPVEVATAFLDACKEYGFTPSE